MFRPTRRHDLGESIGPIMVHRMRDIRTHEAVCTLFGTQFWRNCGHRGPDLNKKDALVLSDIECILAAVDL